MVYKNNLSAILKTTSDFVFLQSSNSLKKVASQQIRRFGTRGENLLYKNEKQNCPFTYFLINLLELNFDYNGNSC